MLRRHGARPNFGIDRGRRQGSEPARRSSRKHPIQDCLARERGSRVDLALPCRIAGQPRLIQVRVTLDPIPGDAPSLRDVAQQFHQSAQLRVGVRVDAVAVVDELDGERPSAVAQDVVRELFLGDACTRRAVPIDHVVNAEHRVRLDVAQIGIERACPDPDRLARRAIAGGAAGGMDDDEIDGLRPGGTGPARVGLDGVCPQH